MVTYDKTEQLVEDRDRLSNDPGNNPDTERNANPASNGEEAVLVHVNSATEDTDVNVLAGDMAEDNTSNNNLLGISLEPSRKVDQHTVGMARP